MSRAWLQLGLALLVGLGAALSAQQARALRSEAREHDVLYLPSSEALRIASLGYDDVAADLLWLRAVTYYGEWRKGEHGIASFRQLADTVTDLDPHFEDAYRFASVVLAEDMGRTDLGIGFLEKGMRAMPYSWWLPFEAGFLEYTVRLDERAASRWFRRAANVPGAPDYPRRFAAFVSSRAGDLQVSYELWKYIAATTPNPDLRLKAMDYMYELEAALKGEGPVPDWARRQRNVNGRVVTPPAAKVGEDGDA